MRYIIPTEPVPLARPRFSKYGVYDSQKLVKDEVAYQIKALHFGKEMFTGPTHLEVIFFMGFPKQYGIAKRKSLELSPHIFRADLDNMIKFLLDVSHGILFKDDCIVCSIHAQKLYSDSPRTEFSLRPF